MDRRGFLRGLLGGAAATVTPERVYSFLRNNPLAPNPLDGYEFRLGAYDNLIVASPSSLVSFNEIMKRLYPSNMIMIEELYDRAILDPFCPKDKAFLARRRHPCLTRA